MICSRCGTAISILSSYCPNCGNEMRPEDSHETSPILQVGRLTAEYSAGQAPSGEWFALGSLYIDEIPNVIPATILVGTGGSHDGAVADLHQEVEREAARLTLR